LGDANIFEFYKCLPLCHNGQSEISYCVKGHDNFEKKQAYKPENKQAKLTQKLVIGLKGDSLMVIQVSLLPGQEKASYQTAEFAQAIFSEENFKDTREIDQKGNVRQFHNKIQNHPVQGGAQSNNRRRSVRPRNLTRYGQTRLD
jgi:hypothetical protein